MGGIKFTSICFSSLYLAVKLVITACFAAPDFRLESFSLTLSHIAVSSSKRVEWETQCPRRSKKVTTFELPVSKRHTQQQMLSFLPLSVC